MVPASYPRVAVLVMITGRSTGPEREYSGGTRKGRRLRTDGPVFSQVQFHDTENPQEMMRSRRGRWARAARRHSCGREHVFSGGRRVQVVKPGCTAGHGHPDSIYNRGILREHSAGEWRAYGSSVGDEWRIRPVSSRSSSSRRFGPPTFGRAGEQIRS